MIPRDPSSDAELSDNGDVAPPGRSLATQRCTWSRRRRRTRRWSCGPRNRIIVAGHRHPALRRGNLQPTPGEIARHCGVSHRSINRYFPDIRSLLRAAVDRQIEVGIPQYKLHAIGTGPIEHRVAEFVRVRLDGFVALGATARAATLMSSSSRIVRTELAAVRDLLSRPGRPPVRSGVRRPPRGATCVQPDGHRCPVPVRVARLLLRLQGLDRTEAHVAADQGVLTDLLAPAATPTRPVVVGPFRPSHGAVDVRRRPRVRPSCECATRIAQFRSRAPDHRNFVNVLA